jgi:glycosyltransferase involved in cell wall biosynthesis
VHLTKDVGQIPCFMHRLFGYDSYIATYRNSERYPALEGEAKGLKLDFIPNAGRRSFVEKEVLNFIRNEGLKIDVLNLYHYSKYSFVYGLLYKKVNPKGILYLKVDAYNDVFEPGKKIKFSRNKIKNLLLKRLEKQFLSRVDLLSIETTEGEKLLRAKFPFLEKKIMRVPVGVNDIFLNGIFPKGIRAFEEKENIILATGRIGEPIKNHEMLLRALAGMQMKDWKMVFVGPVNETFGELCRKFIAGHPALKDKIIFTGEITDRKTLYEWYDRSKIVCMTSVKESFCHTLVEGLYFGNYLVGTEGIMSMQDLTDNEKYGRIIRANDDKMLSDTLQGLIDDPGKIKACYEPIRKHALKRFVWSEIIKTLQQQIEHRS